MRAREKRAAARADKLNIFRKMKKRGEGRKGDGDGRIQASCCLAGGLK